MRNPDWTRDELILALDLYFKIGYGQMDGRNIEVKKLSGLLRIMTDDDSIDDSYRSPNSVALKLANLKRIDPKFTGRGMKGGASLEKEIWEEYSSDKSKLKQVSDLLRKSVIASAVKRRKKKFAEWLKIDGQPNGKPYQEKTVIMYANWVNNIICKEFNIHLTNPIGLFGITSSAELDRIEDTYLQGNTKKRKDLISGYHSYKRYINEMSLDLMQFDADIEIRTEGGIRVYISTRSERDPLLRKQAIKIHGARCMACNFSFEERFGDWGKDFIEVHHLMPLSKKKRRETNPASDLVVLCPNCHRMVHRRKNVVLTLDELKNKIIRKI